MLVTRSQARPALGPRSRPRCWRQRAGVAWSMSTTAPPFRTHHLTDAGTGIRPKFSVLSWNTLADGLAQNGSFSRTPTKALEWSHRLPALLEEIYRHDADIVILQEVNRYDNFDAALSGHGYVGTFCQKQFSACTQLGFPLDGLAVFFKTSRFKSLAPPKHAAFVTADGQAMSQSWLALHLVDKVAQRPLLVATTHLKAKDTPEYAELRLAQARQLVGVLQREATLHDGKAQPAIILGGDFNAPLDAACCQEITGSALGLTPAQRSVPPQQAFSTWKYRRGGNDGVEVEKCCVIDHMWHCAQLNQVVTRAQPTKEECGNGGLPSAAYPSDHLAQFNIFEWRL